MAVQRQARADPQQVVLDELTLTARLSQLQGQVVSQALARAAQTEAVSQENVRLTRDLAGSLDRLQEVHHRIRNHLQTVTGLLAAQEISERSDSARHAIQKSIARLSSIAAIHDLLARDPSSRDLRVVELTQTLTHHLLYQAGADERVRVHLDVAPIALPTRAATAFVLIVAELISNAVEHGFPDGARGEIRVRVAQRGDSAELEIRDTGRGLPAGFELAQAESLGLRLVARLAERDLNGTIASWNEEGACFSIVFPVPGETAS